MDRVEVFKLSENHYSVFYNGHNIRFSDKNTIEGAIALLIQGVEHCNKYTNETDKPER